MSGHSKYPASGMDRIKECPGSAALSATQPSRDTVWTLEGTKAHKVLEVTLQGLIVGQEPNLTRAKARLAVPDATEEMFRHAIDAAQFIIGIFDALKPCDGNQIQVETKVILDWIHKDFGGTFDASVVEVFGVLHIFDYKFGKGVAVSPVQNLQMVTYGCGQAKLFNWNFHTIRHWIIQPRIKGYDGPIFWDVPGVDAKNYWSKELRRIVHTAVDHPTRYREGSWCHWCSAKPVCPLKLKAKREKA